MPEPVSAFHPHASGLIVPQEYARKKVTLTHDELRLIARCMRLAVSKGLILALGCQEKNCRNEPVKMFRGLDGSFRMQCQCTDWIETRAK